MTWIGRKGVLLTAMNLCFASVMSAQQGVVQVRYPPTCPACRIEFTKLASVGAASDPVLIAPTSSLSRDSRGRFYSVGFDRFKVLVYAPDGKFLQSFGAKGDGPGEFGTMVGISAVRVGPADSLYIFSSPGRVSVFTPAYRYARSFRLPISGAVAPQVLPNGSVLFAGRIPTPRKIAERFHIVDRNGVDVSSFGGEGRGVPGQPAPLPVTGAPSPDFRHVWAVASVDQNATPFRHRIAQFPVDSGQRRTFEFVNIPWIGGTHTVLSTRSGGSLTVRDGSINVGWVDRDGLVWLRGLVQKKPVGERRLEVLDPRTGRIVVSQLVEHGFVLLDSRTSELFSLDADKDGFLTFTVWRMVLRRSSVHEG